MQERGQELSAFLETRDACIGDNFLLGTPCDNCNPDCSGVRDIAAFSLGGSATIARPDTVASNTGINCDRFSCPYRVFGIFPYQGPMGYEGHCESYIASGATWDLTQRLVQDHGESGWATMDEIWYSTLNPSKSAYRVASGGKCNPSASVDGCAASNWYTVFLAADDDDGNLAIKLYLVDDVGKAGNQLLGVNGRGRGTAAGLLNATGPGRAALSRIPNAPNIALSAPGSESARAASGGGLTLVTGASRAPYLQRYIQSLKRPPATAR